MAMFVVEVVIIPLAGWQQLAVDINNGVNIWKFSNMCTVKTTIEKVEEAVKAAAEVAVAANNSTDTHSHS